MLLKCHNPSCDEYVMLKIVVAQVQMVPSGCNILCIVSVYISAQN